MSTRAQTLGGRALVAAASADDERAIATWLQQDCGCEVVATTLDGDEALRLALDLRPDLVVANVNLSGASGLELAEQLWARAPAIGCVLVADATSWGAHRRAMRSGALDFLQPPLRPDDAEALRAALRQVVRRRELLGQGRLVAAGAEGEAPQEEPGAGAVISVVSAKGGVGRSLIAATLASWLAERGTTALCDLDFQFGDLSTWGGETQPARTIEELAAVVSANELRLEDVQAIAQSRFGQVAVLAAPRSPVQAAEWSVCFSTRCPLSADYRPADGSPFPAAQLVDAVRRWYQWVVIDHMPGLFDPVVAVTSGADAAVVVTSCEVGALRATQRYLAILDRVAPVPRVVVANRANRGVGRELVRQAVGADEEVVFLDEDATYARALVVDGQGAPQQRGRGPARVLGELAQRLEQAIFAPAEA